MNYLISLQYLSKQHKVVPINIKPIPKMPSEKN